MKTTIDLNDELLASAKALAMQQRVSLTRLVEEGLQLRLQMDIAPGKVARNLQSSMDAKVLSRESIPAAIGQQDLSHQWKYPALTHSVLEIRAFPVKQMRQKRQRPQPRPSIRRARTLRRTLAAQTATSAGG